MKNKIYNWITNILVDVEVYKSSDEWILKIDYKPIFFNFCKKAIMEEILNAQCIHEQIWVEKKLYGDVL